MIDDLPPPLREALFIDSPQAGAVINNLYEITDINKRWRDLFGWTASESEVMSLIDLAEMQRDKKEISDKILLMVETNVQYDSMKMIVRTKLGDLRKVLLQFMAVSDEHRANKFEYAIVWATDLGAFHEAVEEINYLKLWPYVVITSALLWVVREYAEFGQLFELGLSAITGA